MCQRAAGGLMPKTGQSSEGAPVNKVEKGHQRWEENKEIVDEELKEESMAKRDCSSAPPPQESEDAASREGWKHMQRPAQSRKGKSVAVIREAQV